MVEDRMQALIFEAKKHGHEATHVGPNMCLLEYKSDAKMTGFGDNRFWDRYVWFKTEKDSPSLVTREHDKVIGTAEQLQSLFVGKMAFYLHTYKSGIALFPMFFEETDYALYLMMVKNWRSQFPSIISADVDLDKLLESLNFPGGSMNPIEHLKEQFDPLVKKDLIRFEFFNETSRLYIDLDKEYWDNPEPLIDMIDKDMEDAFPGQRDRWSYVIGRNIGLDKKNGLGVIRSNLYNLGWGYINDGLKTFQSWFKGDMIFHMASFSAGTFIPLFTLDTDYELFMLWCHNRWFDPVIRDRTQDIQLQDILEDMT